MNKSRFDWLITNQKDELKKLLPSSISVEKFIEAAKTYYSDALLKDNKSKLVNAEERSIMIAVEKAAKDGLLLDGSESCLMIFGTQAQYNPMTSGFIKLILNSGFVSKLTTYIVYEKDIWQLKIINGEEEMIHEPKVFASEKERGEKIGVYAVAKLKDGNVFFKFLGREKLAKLRAKSQKKDLWDSETEEFWSKSAIRQIAKSLSKFKDSKLEIVTETFESEDIIMDETPSEYDSLLKIAHEKAQEGIPELKKWTESLSTEQFTLIKSNIKEIVIAKSQTKLQAIVNNNQEEDIF